MQKITALDPDLPRQRRTATSGVISSGLVILLALFAVGRLPAVDAALAAANAALQNHNDALVGFLLRVVPFGFVAIASFGLVYRTLGVLNKAGRSS